jgi:hypothetical protein
MFVSWVWSFIVHPILCPSIRGNLKLLVPPKDETVEAGYAASFSVLASGVPPFSYQWQHAGTAIAGATNSSLTLTSVGTNDAGSYNVIVANSYLNVTSAPANLTVTPGPIPPLLTPGRLANNITITFSGEAGRTYRLLSSTNLTVWLPIRTNSVVLGGLVQFVEPITAELTVFYRIVTQ